MKIRAGSRKRFTIEQKNALERAFLVNNHLTAETRYAMAEFLHLTEREVQVWFQNRRARERRMKDMKYEGYRATPSQSPQTPMEGRDDISYYSEEEHIELNGVRYILASLQCESFSDTNAHLLLDDGSAHITIILPNSRGTRKRIRIDPANISSVSCRISRRISHVYLFLHQSPTMHVEMDNNSNCWFPSTDDHSYKHLQLTASSELLTPYFKQITQNDPRLSSQFNMSIEDNHPPTPAMNTSTTLSM